MNVRSKNCLVYLLLTVLLLAPEILYSQTKAAVTVSAGSPTRLILKAPVSKPFNNSQTDRYLIEIRRNEAIEIECTRSGIDVAMTIISPTKEKIVNSNSPLGFIGKDKVSFVADESGTYEILISSRRPGTFAGLYTITWQKQNLASETDIKRFQAMKLLGAARRALESEEKRFETASAALNELKESARLFTELQDNESLANTYFQIGYIIGREHGNERESVKAYAKSLELYEQLGDEAQQSLVLAHLAYELRTTGDHKKSLAYLEKAQRLNRKLKDPLDESVTLTFLCRLYNDTQVFQKGLEACRQALQLGANSDPVSDFYTHQYLSWLYGNIGDSENSHKYLQLTLKRIELAGKYINPVNLAIAKSEMGTSLLAQKKYAQALPHFQSALAASESVNRTFYMAYYENQMALIFIELKEYAKAVEYSEKSLAILRKHHPKLMQYAFRVAAKSYRASGIYDRARDFWLQAVEQNKNSTDTYAESETLFELAAFEKSLGNLETAYQHLHRAVTLSEIIRAQLIGQNQRSSYLTILRSYYELEIDLLADLYEVNKDQTLLEKSWQNQERIRARSLTENFLVNGYSLQTSGGAEFFQREQMLLKTIAEHAENNNKALQKKNEPDIKKTEEKLQTALAEYQLLKEETRKGHPRFSALNSLREFTFADAQDYLDADSAILEFGLGESRSFAWLITKKSVKVVKLPAKDIINQLSRNFYDSLTNLSAVKASRIEQERAELSRLLLTPLSDEIKELKKLIIIADGSLQFIPFSYLSISGAEPLAKTHEIVNAPSFAGLVHLKENKIKRQVNTNQTLAILADPIFQRNDERISGKRSVAGKTENSQLLKPSLRDYGINTLARLPFSGFEAREISKYVPQETILATGAEASRENFLSGKFSNYRILHFATHGFLNQKTPDLSGLVLAMYDAQGNPKNGFLRVIDLYSLQLNSDLVVLSACQTALGKEINGEEIIGLTNGFIYAGVSAVISGLWKVDDAATAEFMKRFYRVMLKENKLPAEALRTAQLEMQQIPRFSHPRFWAAFILTGESL